MWSNCIHVCGNIYQNRALGFRHVAQLKIQIHNRTCHSFPYVNLIYFDDLEQLLPGFRMFYHNGNIWQRQ